MRFRWKLLVLLLVIALLPVLSMRLGFVRSIRLLGIQTVQRTGDEFSRRAEERMRLVVEGGTTLIRTRRAHLEEIGLMQSKEVERLLGVREYQDVPVYFPEDFSNSKRAPGDLSASSVHCCQLMGGEVRPMEVSFLHQVFSLPPGVSRETVEDDVRRLAPMSLVYRTLAMHTRNEVLWHYITLTNGLHCIYPGHGNVPADMDARQQPWFQPIEVDQRPPYWAPPYRDLVTGQSVLVMAFPVHRPGGEFAGVTGVVLTLEQAIEQRLMMRNLPSGTQLFLTGLEREPGREETYLISIADERHPHPGIRRNESGAVFGRLESNDRDEFNKMIRDLGNRTTNVRRMPYKGRDSLWAYGSVMYASNREQAHLLLITPYDSILEPAMEMKRDIEAGIDNLIGLTRFGVAGLILLVIVLALVFSRSVTRPLHKLALSASRLAQGDLKARTEIRSRDEFGDMARIFNSVGPRLEEHIRLARSVEVAREVQQNLLPDQAPKVRGLDIAGASIYCDETGGDYYDYIDHGPLEAGRVDILVGDVSGHGVQAALLMASTRALLRQRATMPGSIGDVVSDVNNLLVRDAGDTGMFVTLLYGTIHTGNSVLQWVSAGHEPILLYDLQLDRFLDIEEGRSPALGVMDGFFYKVFSRPVSPGQTIVIGTDGIWETHNPDGEMFGKENLRRLIRVNARESAEKIVTGIVDAVSAFRGDREQEDDVTLVVVKVLEA